MGASDPWSIGPRIRHWRTARGMSRRTLAGLLGRSESWLEMAEIGKRAPYRLDDLIDIARALRVDLGRLLGEPAPGIEDDEQQQLLALLRGAFAGREPIAALAALARITGPVEPGDELMLVVEAGGAIRLVNRREMFKTGGALVGVSLAGSVGWLDRDGELTGATISLQGAERLGLIVAEFRCLDDEVGPGPLRTGVASHLGIVEGLRGWGADDRVERELGRIAAELEQLGGYLAYNAGRRRQAVDLLRKAHATARRVQDDQLAAYVLGWVSVAAGEARPGEAVAHADSGLDHARKAGPRRLVAALCLRSARAHALVGDVGRVKARIDEARKAFAEDPEDPAWLYWLDRGELDAQAARAYVILERPRDAEPLSRDALGRLDAGQVQQAGLRQTSLARTLAFAGQVEEAAVVGLDAYRSYQRCPADWTRRNLRELAPLLRDSRDPAVVELRERLATV